MELPPAGHDPVLLHEILALLDPQPGKVFVDCTLGRGGHARAVAGRLGAQGLFIGIDADPRNLEFAAERLRDAPCAVRLFHANFAELADVLAKVGDGRNGDPRRGEGEIRNQEAREGEIRDGTSGDRKIPGGAVFVDGILADLGISTNQLFDEAYGMSFDRPMPLDMRIDPRLRQSAADLVNQMREDDLANVLYELAQERYSRRIARKIVEARRISPIHSTDRLAGLVRSAMPPRHGPPEKIDPATRTFLALRMAVNQEMQNLSALLERAPRHLKPLGRLAVISFQSMEDRAVKQAFRSLEQTGQARILTKKPLSPGDKELSANPRSRSAKLRVIERMSSS